jgi:hypothetical protein
MTRRGTRTARGVVAGAVVVLVVVLGAAAFGVGPFGSNPPPPAQAGPAATAAGGAGIPVEPSRAEARSWANRELAGREYQGARPGVVERIIRWVIDRLSGVRFSGRPFSIALLTTILVTLLVLVAVAITLTGGLRRPAKRRTPALFERDDLSAADHRTAAERHAAAGEWEPAVVERFRAVARTLEEHAVISPQPGRTADEVARDAGTWLPGLAEDLAAGARVFDDVRYGSRGAGEPAYARLRALDDRVREAKPAGGDGPRRPAPGLAVPQ